MNAEAEEFPPGSFNFGFKKYNNDFYLLLTFGKYFKYAKMMMKLDIIKRF